MTDLRPQYKHDYSLGAFLADLIEGGFSKEGHPKFYLGLRGKIYCHDCVERNKKSIRHSMASGNPSILGSQVNLHDANAFCSECSERIRSAYAEHEPHNF